MFSIQGSQGMMELPSLTEEISYRCPFLGCRGTSYHFLLIFLDDGFADNIADRLAFDVKEIFYSIQFHRVYDEMNVCSYMQ